MILATSLSDKSTNARDYLVIDLRQVTRRASRNTGSRWSNARAGFSSPIYRRETFVQEQSLNEICLDV